MIICGFCSRGLARRSRLKRDCRLRHSKFRIWLTGLWRWRRARAAICWRRSCATARASIVKNLPSFANKAFNVSKWMALFMIWMSRPRSTKNFAMTSMWSWTGLWCAKGLKPVWQIVFGPLWIWPMASPFLKRPPVKAILSATRSVKNLPARFRALPSRKLNRVCSPSTRPSAPVRNVTAWGLNCSLMNVSWCLIKP